MALKTTLSNSNRCFVYKSENQLIDRSVSVPIQAFSAKLVKKMSIEKRVAVNVTAAGEIYM